MLSKNLRLPEISFQINLKFKKTSLLRPKACQFAFKAGPIFIKGTKMAHTLGIPEKAFLDEEDLFELVKPDTI